MVSMDGKTFLPFLDSNNYGEEHSSENLGRSAEHALDRLSWSKRDPSLAIDR